MKRIVVLSAYGKASELVGQMKQAIARTGSRGNDAAKDMFRGRLWRRERQAETFRRWLEKNP